MDAARRVLLLDFGMALSWIALGALQASPATLAGRWWVVALAFAVTVGTWHVGDRRTARRGGWAAVAVGGLALFVLPFALALALLTVGPPISLIAAGLVGVGLGVCGYRTLYGLVWSIPEHRLERARGRSV